MSKILRVAVAALIAFVGFMYLRNATPTVPPTSDAEAASPTRPYVVKLHAQWCPVCMMTKGVWSEIEKTYAGRVNLVVFDFSNDATTGASEVEARRLGLGQFFAESQSTGTIAVLDGRTKEVAAMIHGSRDVAEYRTAIDAALAAMSKQAPAGRAR